ncbi:hypothetical protein ACFS07_26800 [Undibacterium arcticum]
MKPITNHLISKTVAVLIALASFDAQCGTLGVYTSDQKGFDTHTFWYDDGKEVTLIDTQFVPQLTEAMVQQVKSSTASPITRVIVTHANPDKYNGLAYLHKLGVESITSAAVSREMPVVHAYKEKLLGQRGKDVQARHLSGIRECQKPSLVRLRFPCSRVKR